jgi:hypothetical protein
MRATCKEREKLVMRNNVFKVKAFQIIKSVLGDSFFTPGTTDLPLSHSHNNSLE